MRTSRRTLLESDETLAFRHDCSRSDEIPHSHIIIISSSKRLAKNSDMDFCYHFVMKCLANEQFCRIYYIVYGGGIYNDLRLFS